MLFCYRRLDTLIQVIDSLKNNSLAQISDLIIFSDGWIDAESQIDVLMVREYIAGISGFNSLRIYESNINKGLANSIIEGVSAILNEYQCCIVLEDDLIVSSNFLDFMNQGLNYYQNNEKVISICGYSPLIDSTEDVYFTQRSSSWGWATWSNRWDRVDWDCRYYNSFKYNIFKKIQFNKMGSDLSWMLMKQMNGNINSWAIRFCFHQFQNSLYSIHPTISKIENIGIAHYNATNTYKSFNRFKSKFDITHKVNFQFKSQVKLESTIISQFVKVNSIKARILNKILLIIERINSICRLNE